MSYDTFKSFNYLTYVSYLIYIIQYRCDFTFITYNISIYLL